MDCDVFRRVKQKLAIDLKMEYDGMEYDGIVGL
jgi:hypothetical protein